MTIKTFMITISLVSLALTGCAQTSTPTATSEPSAAPQQAQVEESPQLDVPYVPTPTEVVDAMLKVAKVGKNDVLYDLGSGDGRIPITAAKRFGTRGFGVDIDPQRIQEANANAQKEGVSDLVKFAQQDLFKTDLSKATVISLYLLPRINLELRPKLLQLKPGTRIVSHAFDMGDWKPDQVVNVGGTTVYYWVVPEEVPANLKK
ncbi:MULTISPECIES: SAM-dependent methyltransferase [Leptolyngbya]|uniref:SAM-dependent methyltransferase n=1 Tax=Leptolyngbya TaxID=47251 RepID=UPI001687C672|nr:methyltransferase domain-containing protein [Leptolyngbya sp. FACHB-1624]MBD1856870.1 class I SAM-dependent methyltransferase [Leptolyngbya sp. FACHB-1624]